MPVINPKIKNMKTMMYNYFWGKEVCPRETLDREVSRQLILLAKKVYHYIECRQGENGWEYHLLPNGKKYLYGKNDKK